MAQISSAAQSISRSSLIRFSVLLVISLLIWWRPLLSSLNLAMHDGQYTHLLLILPVSVALIVLEWNPREAPESFSRASFIVSVTLLSAALLLTLDLRFRSSSLHLDEQLALHMLALVLWWMAAFLLSFGFPAFRRAIFPLCFLLWLVPWPEFLLNPAVRLLQQGSAASARILFNLAHVPVAQDGTVLSIPGLTLEVARECSSIRSSLMLVVTTMVLAQICLRSTWRKVAIVAVAIPLSVAKNGLRIVVLGLLTTRVDRSFISGRLHHQGGVIYLLVTLVAVGALIWIAHHFEKEPVPVRLSSPRLAADSVPTPLTTSKQ